MDADRVTAPGLAGRKARGATVDDKIVMVTAYDATFARSSTRPASTCSSSATRSAWSCRAGPTRCPSRSTRWSTTPAWSPGAATRALVVGDLPFGSYQVSPQQARARAHPPREGGRAAAVKLEGGVADGRDDRGHHPRRHPGRRRTSASRRSRSTAWAATGCRAAAPGSEAGGRERLIDDAKAVEAGRRVRRRARGHPACAGGRDHATALDPDHRHRRRPPLRRPGARAPRRARASRPNALKFAKAYADLRAEVDRRRCTRTSRTSEPAPSRTTSTRSTSGHLE